MAYTSAEGRRQLLDDLAAATDALGAALAALAAGYDLLDERSADRMEEDLFGPVQKAYGRAQRAHAAFAARHGQPGRAFAQPSAGPPSRDVRTFLQRAVDAVDEADERLAELQDSMLPVEVGDAELRAGLAGVRALVADVRASAREFTRTLGR